MCADRDAFGFHFVTAARAWRRVVDQELAAAGLTDATWAPLVHLHAGGDGISQTELAGRLGLDGSTLVRLLDLLEGRGLVARQVDPRDRRARRIVLTEAGRAEVAGIRAKLRRIEHALLAGVGDEALAAVMAGLAQIHATAASMLERGA